MKRRTDQETADELKRICDSIIEVVIDDAVGMEEVQRRVNYFIGTAFTEKRSRRLRTPPEQSGEHESPSE